MAIRWILLTALAGGIIFPAKGDVVLDWNALLIDAIRTQNTAANPAARNFAILHVAIWDSVNSVLNTHQPYSVLLKAPPQTSVEAAAVGAARHVFASLYPTLSASSDALYEQWFASAKVLPGRDEGLQLGARVAALILERRAYDGSAIDVPYIPCNTPGAWQRTSPFFRPPLGPQWGKIDLFCLPAVEPFLQSAPPQLGSSEYAADFNEVKALGSRISSKRTAEQSGIATFWSDFSYTATPPGHWQQIAASIARARHNSLFDNARLFALLSLAQAETSIVCWEAKYRHNFWRPITAIQRAGEDTNPATEADPTWTSLLVTPAFPSYTSGHSAFSKASAEVLARFYGTDNISFSTTSDALPGVTRTFTSLSECVNEVGRSRVYGGIHFEFDNQQGKQIGLGVAEYISSNYLLRKEGQPKVRLDRIDGAKLQFRIFGQSRLPYVLQSSSNLVTWDPMLTNAATLEGGLVTYGKAGEQR